MKVTVSRHSQPFKRGMLVLIGDPAFDIDDVFVIIKTHPQDPETGAFLVDVVLLHGNAPVYEEIDTNILLLFPGQITLENVS